MSIVIYNKNANNSFEEKALAAAKEMCNENVLCLCTKVDLAANELRKHRLVVAHLSTDQWSALITGKLSEVQVIIRVSSVGRSGMSDSFGSPYRYADTGPWILHVTEPCGVITSERWKEIFAVIKAWDTSSASLPDDVRSMFDPHPEYRVAFLILCEAWCLTHGGSEPTPQGVTIHAPSTPNDWFGPFEKPVGKKSAVEIAKLMWSGNGVNKRVEEILCSVCDGKLSWTDSRAHEKIKSLCEDLKKAAR